MRKAQVLVSGRPGFEFELHVTWSDESVNLSALFPWQ